jgi:hypothetical protein
VKWPIRAALSKSSVSVISPLQEFVTMSTVLETPTPATMTRAGQRLQQRTAAVRLSFTWLGVRKTLTAEQKAQAAETFGAQDSFLSAGKKLLDTSHQAFRDVTAVRGQIQSYFKNVSLPFPEPGVRLLRQDQVTPFVDQLSMYRNQLEEAVTELDSHYSELQSAARRRLGTLYNAADYPGSLIGLFSVDWDFPSVEPPEYLRQLSPELYEQEQARIVARFEEAVQLAEEAFTSELAKLVSHLADRVSGSSDGKPKIFRDTAVTNLHEFFERFRTLSVRSDADLERLVDQAQQMLQGVEPQNLRHNGSARQHLANQLSTVQSALDGLMVDRPRRNLIRPNRREETLN